MSNKNTSWGPVAEWYDGHLKDIDSYHLKVIIPNLLRIVDPKPGMNVLDVACGQGKFVKTLVERGARVIGCDISSELIDIAKKNLPVGQFFVSPSHEFISKAPAEIGTPKDMDVVTIILALQNIEKLSDTLLETAKVLKKGSRLVFVLNHPAFRITGRTSWQFDDKSGMQYRRLDGYMSESSSEINMNPGEKDRNKSLKTVSFHRPLQVYFKALSKAGFAVTRLEEWISHKESEPGPRKKEEDRMRKEIPLFMCIEAVLL